MKLLVFVSFVIFIGLPWLNLFVFEYRLEGLAAAFGLLYFIFPLASVITGFASGKRWPALFLPAAFFPFGLPLTAGMGFSDAAFFSVCCLLGSASGFGASLLVKWIPRILNQRGSIDTP